MMYRILDEDIMKDNDSAVIKTLQEAPLRGHLVDFYDDPMRLAERVADFAEPGPSRERRGGCFDRDFAASRPFPKSAP
jgi:hypothetical protein